MAETPKVLGQVAPLVTTLTDLYVVPASKAVIGSSVVVCNRSASPVTFRVSVAIAGAGDTVAQYLLYDVPCPGNDSYIATIGMTLATTDEVRVYAGTAVLSFNMFGVEIDV